MKESVLNTVTHTQSQILSNAKTLKKRVGEIFLFFLAHLPTEHRITRVSRPDTDRDIGPGDSFQGQSHTHLFTT